MTIATVSAAADKGHTIAKAARLLKHYVYGNTPAMLWGPPGVGKSDIVAQLAAAERQARGNDEKAYGFIDQRLTTLESVDLRGLPFIHDGKAVWANPDILPNADRDGKEGILFLDEINAAPASTQAACYQLILNRRVGDYRLPQGWRIVAAGNRQKDRASANKMPSALGNRFAHIHCVADVETWCNWAISAAVHPAMIAFIRFRPQLLHVMPGATISDPKEGLEIALPADTLEFPTPRSITEAAPYADAPDEDRTDLIAGNVGKGFATEFAGFFRTFTELPSIAQILADPNGAKVPTGPGALFAVSAAIARKATPVNYGAILTYAQRLPKSYEVLAAVDAQNRDKTLAETGAWVSWCGANAGVFA
ncbi:MAG: AAA family ATPase [Caulobacterales bacterium]